MSINNFYVNLDLHTLRTIERLQFLSRTLDKIVEPFFKIKFHSQNFLSSLAFYKKEDWQIIYKKKEKLRKQRRADKCATAITLVPSQDDGNSLRTIWTIFPFFFPKQLKERCRKWFNGMPQQEVDCCKCSRKTRNMQVDL